MKTEITIDGVTYKVGDVLERSCHVDCKIIYIGDDAFFCEYTLNGTANNIATFFSDLAEWKIKKPKKKIVVERWFNIYPDRVFIWEAKDKAEYYKASDLIATEYVKF